jgi:hypothetical protein
MRSASLSDERAFTAFDITALLVETQMVIDALERAINAEERPCPRLEPAPMSGIGRAVGD